MTQAEANHHVAGPTWGARGTRHRPAIVVISLFTIIACRSATEKRRLASWHTRRAKGERRTRVSATPTTTALTVRKPSEPGAGFLRVRWRLRTEAH
jgi:hypothetical protein